MDVLVTGASGFLGSQLVVEWLRRHPEARVACLVRAEDAAAAARRLRTALLRAIEDRALDGGAQLLSRATAIPGGLEDAGWHGAVRDWRAGRDGGLRVLHCAANLSFRMQDRDEVRAVNIDGTRALAAAAVALGAAEFNYVSTAYVAGDRAGTIGEDDVSQPAAFSNAYEESKWEAEAVVRAACAATGLAFRILRPSIIIGHSVTHRVSSLSGFYKVVETVLQLGRVQRRAGQEILLPLALGATLDLIPIDVVVAEAVQILEAGEATLGHAFHLTSDQPVPLIEALATLSPLAGFAIGRLAPGDAVGRLGGMLMQRLRHYTPYLGQIRSFDRRNVRAAGVPVQAVLDVPRLQPYVASFISRTRAALRPIGADMAAAGIGVSAGRRAPAAPPRSRHQALAQDHRSLV